VGRIRDALEKGLPVATNLDLYLEHVRDKYNNQLRVIRVPDKPTSHDLYNLGSANDTYDEEKNGLLVLDECGTWFNSRNWNDKARKDVIDWFLHARKLGWDIIFIVQDISLVDKQAREALAEHTVFTRRLDRIKIPFIGNLFKLFTGRQLRLPRIHRGKVHYGDSEQALVVDTWTYSGKSLYKLYDTKQCFTDSDTGIYSLLTPWHLVGRYCPKVSLLDQTIELLLFSLKIILYTPILINASWYGRSPRHVALESGVFKITEKKEISKSLVIR